MMKYKANYLFGKKIFIFISVLNEDAGLSLIVTLIRSREILYDVPDSDIFPAFTFCKKYRKTQV